jgi:hypothetical protein
MGSSTLGVACTSGSGSAGGGAGASGSPDRAGAGGAASAPQGAGGAPRGEGAAAGCGAANCGGAAGVPALPPPPVPRSGKITLTPNGGSGAQELVTLGIPFYSGVLKDAAELQVRDVHGKHVRVFVEPTLRWHWVDDSIRAVKVQFIFDASQGPQTLSFSVGEGRRAGPDLQEQPYATGTRAGKFGQPVPRVLATVDAEWLSSSRIAGPQQPKTAQTAYDTYFEAQFAWAKDIDYEGSFDYWLFDRPTSIYKQYVRTGNPAYLAEAFNSYRFYIDHVLASGPNAGGFSMQGKPPEDIKYIYVEPTLLHLALTGDDVGLAKAPLSADYMFAGGWNAPPAAYTRVDQNFTERQYGLTLLSQVAAFEITGQKKYLERVNQQVKFFYDHQRANPDGLPYDGSWRHDWNVHEGGSGAFDPEEQLRGASPWMSENIIDGLWHAWLITRDERIPEMLRGFALDFMEKHGWAREPWFTQAGTTWMSGCNTGGTLPLYWASSTMSDPEIIGIQEKEGWYSDAHTPEMALVVGAAYYFSGSDADRAKLRARMQLIERYYNKDCGSDASTVRKFNWNNRGSAVARWFMAQP